MASDGFVHIGHIKDLARPRRSGVPLRSRAMPRTERDGAQVIGAIGDYPVVLKPKPKGRYVLDAQTGAIQFEHDLGPKAEAAMLQVTNSIKNVELSLDHLRETVATLRSPFRRTMLVIGALAAVGALAAGAYYLLRKKPRVRRKKPED